MRTTHTGERRAPLTVARIVHADRVLRRRAYCLDLEDVTPGTLYRQRLATIKLRELYEDAGATLTDPAVRQGLHRDDG